MEKDTSEIEKLTERIAKDPKSKLFVPLAEEYKKVGNIDMAIQVLRDGLKNNPGYVTARSFLGRLLLEQGDLAGAQKDLEEVIKAIPDNLLAQRKLGDLYVLLGRGSDAVQRYKTALALNPGDKEVMSLLADLEAGKDVSSRIPKPKSISAAPAARPQAAVAAPLTTKAPARTVPPPAAQATPPAGAKTPAASPAPGTPAAAKASSTPPPPPAPPAAAKAPFAPPSPPKAVPAPAAPIQPATPAQPARDEVEVVEDIVELEPLERPAASSVGREMPFRKPEETLTAPSFDAGPPPAETTFDLSEPVVEQKTDREAPLAGSWPEEAPVAPPEVSTGAAEEGADDLNTNTLAELYISQGFYEKAIEVYQGMLAERPENKALQQKLEHLRALAGAPETSAVHYTAVPGGPGEYLSPATDIFAEAEAAAPAEPLAATPVPEQTAASEQKPAELPPRKETPVPVPDTVTPRGPQTATVRRKETIDRLESWLKNIMKEKQE